MRPDHTRFTALPDDLDRDASIAHLALVLAHRLRGLVAGIEGFTDLLSDTLMDEEQRELAMKIMEGTARIESVLADLQLYGEFIDPVMLPVRVDEVVRDLLVPLSDEDRGRVRIEMVDDAARSMMSADPFLLRQLLLILLQNALEAGRAPAAVRLAIAARSAAVRFEVWNEGLIETDDAATAVFAPFYTTKAHNLGVGLSIAQRIARLHEARVELVCNDREEGTCFAFSLSDPGDDLG
jgi:signal transduction histidine kinase